MKVLGHSANEFSLQDSCHQMGLPSAPSPISPSAPLQFSTAHLPDADAVLWPTPNATHRPQNPVRKTRPDTLMRTRLALFFSPSLVPSRPLHRCNLCPRSRGESSVSTNRSSN